jgi:protein-tyrosine phosphatase
MDKTHVLSLHRLASTDAMKGKVSLARDHVADGPRDLDVPDPYYGEVEGFDEVVDICVEACAALLEVLRRKHAL